jgi:hypothetical protein
MLARRVAVVGLETHGRQPGFATIADNGFRLGAPCTAHQHEAMSKQLANIHDAFFKQILSDPNLAGTFLSEHLPPDVAGLLDPASPEPVPGSFVDEELRQHHSDLLFRVRLKAGRDAFAYVLLEHKSSPDPGARLQLLRYVVRMLVQWYDQNKQQLPLPPASIGDAIALDVPVGLFECARRHLLENEPLHARSSDRTAVPHALSASERVEPLSPRDWLLSGRAVERVVALARGFR